MSAPKRTKQGAPKLASELSQEYLDSLAKSKAEAHKMNTNIYFDGTPCLQGHVATRARSSGRCNHCNDLSRKKRIKSMAGVTNHVKTFMVFGQPMELLSSCVR
jgi:hypothetical protein